MHGFFYCITYWSGASNQASTSNQTNNRHPSVRLTMDSILIVCLAGAPASVAEEADAGMTVFVTDAVSGLLRLSLCFLWIRLSVAACVSFSSPDLRCLVKASLHLNRLAARLSQDSVLMSTVFMSRFKTSRYRSCGRPMDLFPQASSPYRRSFGMRPSGMRWTWPSQQSLRCLSSVNMLGRPARDSTSLLVTLSCHDIPRMRRRLLMWKVFRRLPCLAYVVHVSLPYSRVLMTQVLYTAILVFVVNLGLIHTRVVRRARVVAAFPILLSSSASRERLSVIVEPRYVN